MANLVLKISSSTKKAAEAAFYYKDVDAFSDKYALPKVDLLADVEAVKASLRNILLWSVGEEILYPSFGNNLRKYLYQPLEEDTKNQLAQELKRCIEENDKRIAIDGLAISQDTDDQENSVVHLKLSYHVIGAKASSKNISTSITLRGGKNGEIEVK